MQNHSKLALANQFYESECFTGLWLVSQLEMNSHPELIRQEEKNGEKKTKLQKYC